MLGHDLDQLGRVVTGRPEPAFVAARRAHDATVEATYRGARVLVTGGAGFIGGQTLRQILSLEPALVVVVDTWENGLAELVRDLRSAGAIGPATRFEPRLVSVTSPLVERVVLEDGPFDVVLAFAAAKHVRTERDVVSALSMLDTNVNGTHRVLRACAATNPECRLFMVSTDKAADPSSLMGASKRAMEDAVLAELPHATTTRFANVAFSSGSLLESWLIRLANGQALPVPRATSRFFVSAGEAGRLCLLASTAPAGSIVVPAEGAVAEVELSTALTRLLDHLGLAWHEVDAAGAEGSSPTVRVLRSPRDTSGEKAAEVFVGTGEHREPWLTEIDRVVSDEPRRPRGLGEWVAAALAGRPGPTLPQVLARVADAVPDFTHVASNRRLDDRI